MERKQKRRRKDEREKGTRGRSSKARAKTKLAMTISMAEEANAPSAGDNRAGSDGGSQKDKCSSSMGTRAGDGSSQKRPLCNGGR